MKNEIAAEIYTTPTCHYCKDVKSLLDKHDIPYVAYDVTKDPEARKRLDELGERGVPVTVIGKTKIVGYNEEQLKKVFNIS